MADQSPHYQQTAREWRYRRKTNHGGKFLRPSQYLRTSVPRMMATK